MPSENKGHDQPNTPYCQSHQGNVPPVSAEQGATDHKTSADGTPESTKETKSSEPPRTFVGWSLLFDALLVIATSIYVCFAYQQWKTMDNQAKIMKGQLTAAKDSIEIAKKTLEDARKSGDEQSARAERLTKANEKIAQASKQSVDTARQVAKKSLDATIENFRLEQRAWVGVVHTLPPEYKEAGQSVYVKDGQPMKTGVTIVNSGKTPARNVHNIVSMFYWKSSDEFTPTFNKVVTIGDGPSTAVLQPSAFFVINARPIPEEGSINKADIANITNGRYILYIAGKITYEDVFTRPHSTSFCMFLDPSLTIFNNCKGYNEAN